MTNESQEFKFKFSFAIPADHLLAFARESVESPNADLCTVANAMLDVTSEAEKIRQGFANNGKVDLAPFFDFWFADAIDAAKRLKKSPDDNTRHLADCLITQEQSIIESKEDFLTETKRLKLKPQR